MSDMDIVIGYQSALEYWRSLGADFLRGYRARQTATRHARAALEAKEKPYLIGGNRRPAGCSLPVHVLVADAQIRTETSRVISHTWADIPEKSVIDAGEGFLVSSPEFCFLQMAGRLSLAQLIQLGFELCGTYALAGDNPAVRREGSLTSVARLEAFVAAATHAYGRAKALRSIRYLMEGSASPMETVLAIMLCLPYKLGGYGLEKPLLNYRVDVPRGLRKLADRGYCECDLCWPAQHLCVEYDSKLYHQDPARQESDATRRSTLISLGYTVVTVTYGQVADGAAFNRLAHQLAKRTRRRLRYQDPDFTRKHLELRAQLFGGVGTRS